MSFPAILKIQLVDIGKNTEMNSRMTPHLWIKCSTLIVFTTVLQTACDVHAAPGPRLLVPEISDQPSKIRQVTTTNTEVDEPLVARKPDLSVEAQKPKLVADDKTDKKSKTDAVPEPKPFPGIAKKTTPSMEKPKAPEVPKIVDPLDKLVDDAIEVSHRRMLRTNVHTPWQIAHGILALRWEYALYQNDKRIRAIDWVSTGPSFRGRPWFITTDNGGKGHPFTEPYAFEGHPNQFLAFYGMAGIPLDHKFNTGEKIITIADMIRNAKAEVNTEEEITWTLWAFSRYLPWDTEWTSNRSEEWSIEKLVQVQMQSEPTKSACGGTHGLFALASAVNSYAKDQKHLRGTWLEASMRVRQYIEYARSMQNRDGSFSSKYFEGPEYASDVNKRVSTTGHTLEFIMEALPQKRLNEPWVRSAVARIANDLIQYKTQPLEPGGMYHAIDSLVIYRERTRPTYADELEELAKNRDFDEPEPSEPIVGYSKRFLQQQQNATQYNNQYQSQYRNSNQSNQQPPRQSRRRRFSRFR
ncbi:hypothetical protein Enr17x_51180 [Gimesia fumaroli]|uniref:Uncharacterized protein n=2 Tax=Gimesia fumaroli TaxID=2527976 RepID=A0A518IIX4_9PLAN|nr:hypothetical protein Enr17x_51180 [Gimesia fumaroli]